MVAHTKTGSDYPVDRLAEVAEGPPSHSPVDAYFLAKERCPLAELVEQARKKRIGMDDYWLAQAYAQVRTVSLLPRMIRPLDLDEMKAFFLDERTG